MATQVQISVQLDQLDLRHADTVPVTGDDVKGLQGLLNACGASPQLAIDGIAGPKTRQATINFQGAAGLVQDQIVGPKTWTALLNRM